VAPARRRRATCVRIGAAQRKRLKKAGVKSIRAFLRVSVKPAKGATVKRTLRVRVRL
jgi:hypothetical protein